MSACPHCRTEVATARNSRPERASPSAGEPTREQIARAIVKVWFMKPVSLDGLTMVQQEQFYRTADAIQALYRRQSGATNGET
jgi:hypothetical protein